MSATLPNLDMLSRWLGGDLYYTAYRPVPLTEMVKIGPVIYDSDMKKLRDIDMATAVARDDDHVIPLCKETIMQGHSVLIFCPTKNWCEKQAESIARHFAQIGSATLALKNGDGVNPSLAKASDLINFDYESLREVFEQLKRTHVGLDAVLMRTIPHAVAFHHAGLTFDERDIIEGAFRQGSIRVLVATSTLCSGVNLPARRVIIRTPTFHGKMVDPLAYKQMAGRAGRKGVDSIGESVLICKMSERSKATQLMKSSLKAVHSCLLDKERTGGLKRALLEVISSGVVTGPGDVERYAACTFFASSSRDRDITGESAIPATITFLVENEFIRLVTAEHDGKASGEKGVSVEKYVPTQLGAATVASSLSPDEALVVFAELQKARKCFVLESELHIIYQVTPIYVQAQWPNLNWDQFLRIWERLPTHMRRVADIVGIQESYISLASRGRIPTRTDQHRQQLAVHRRFFAALALQDLVREVPLNVVAHKYGATKGMIQSLQGSASTFAGMVTVFCQKLGWLNMELLLAQFQSRLSFGVERELCDLVRISLLNAARARMLYNAGFHTVAMLAKASTEDVEMVLRNAMPFTSEKKHQGETDIEVKHRRDDRVIWVAGKRGLSEKEAANLIVTEAKQLLHGDVAQLGIHWKPSTQEQQQQQSSTCKNETRNLSSSSSVNSPRLSSGSRGRVLNGIKKRSREMPGNRRYVNQRQSLGRTKTRMTPRSNAKSNEESLGSDESPELMNTSDKRLSAEQSYTNAEGSTVVKSRQNEQTDVSVEAEDAAIDVVATVTEFASNASQHLKSTSHSNLEADMVNNGEAITRKKDSFNTEVKQYESIPYSCKSVEPGALENGPGANAHEPEIVRETSGKTKLWRRGGSQQSLVRKNEIPMTSNECSYVQRDGQLYHEGAVQQRPDELSSPDSCIIGIKRRSPSAVDVSPQQKLFRSASLHNNEQEQIVRTPQFLNELQNQAESAVTESASIEEESCLSAVLFDTSSIDTSYVKGIHEGQSTSFELYSEQLEVEKENTSNCKERECNMSGSQALDYTMSDSYIAQCWLSQPNAANTNLVQSGAEQIAGYDGVVSLCDDVIAECGVVIDAGNDVIIPNHKSSDRDNAVRTENNTDPDDVVADTDDVFGEIDYCTEYHGGESTQCCLQSPRNAMEAPSSTSPVFTEIANKSCDDVEQDDVITGDTCSFSLKLSLSGSCVDSCSDMMNEIIHCSEDEGIIEEHWTLTEDSLKRTDSKFGDPDFQLKSKKSETGKITRGMSDDQEQHDVVSDVERAQLPSKFTKLKSNKCNSLKPVAKDDWEETSVQGKGIELQTNPPIAETPEPDHSTSSQNNRQYHGSTPRLSWDSDELKSPTPTAQSPTTTQSGESVSIIDLCANNLLFDTFIKEWKTRKYYSFAVACERRPDNVQTIGGRFNSLRPTGKNSSLGLEIEGTDEVMVGLAVCWGGKDAYYISLRDCNDSDEEMNSSPRSAGPAVAASLPLKRRLDGMKSVLETKGRQRGGVKICFHSIQQYKVLSQACGISVNGDWEDPRVASWLLDPGTKEKTLQHLVGQYASDKVDFLRGIGGETLTGSLALATHNSHGGRVRACTEAVVSIALMKQMRSDLKEDCLEQAFQKVEMPVMRCLARMELNGFGFSDAECDRLKSILQAKLRMLEQEAYRLADHSFSLTSPEDVARILFIELRLPADGKLDDTAVAKRRTLGTTRRGANSNRKALRHLSTNKDVLERLKPLHPLPGVIQEWRKVNCALTKIVFPVQREKRFHKELKMNRIYPTSQTHTSTGRVSFNEPNLQNVPRDFDIALPTVIAESPPLGRNRQTKASLRPTSSNSIQPGPSCAVSMRNAFVPFTRGVLLAADYSQLELRLIAHLARDMRLRELLNNGGDVFKLIAGSLSGVEPELVDDKQRQRAKQICYGIIYGIGAKTLGGQLELDEDDASMYIEKFKSRFNGIRKYLKDTVEQCRRDGYVTTITKRRRYLPAVNSPHPHARSQAERQAVNTTIQGSAADLVKIAMINIDRKLTEAFPACERTHRQKNHTGGQGYEVSNSRRRSSRISGLSSDSAGTQALHGAHMVLQLHDELVFEVAERDLDRVVKIVKSEMENAMKLSVVLPVKMKVGPSWGAMCSTDS